jgi:hypothetical protein
VRERAVRDEKYSNEVNPPFVALTARNWLSGAVARYRTSLIPTPESRGIPGPTGLTIASSTIQLDHGELSSLTN